MTKRTTGRTWRQAAAADRQARATLDRLAERVTLEMRIASIRAALADLDLLQIDLDGVDLAEADLAKIAILRATLEARLAEAAVDLAQLNGGKL